MSADDSAVAFKNAIVRPPCATFADGISSGQHGRPDLAQALAQHEAYCAALESCGLALTRLAPDDAFPDSTFVEDAALVTEHGALLARPGAPSRAGEVAAVAAALTRFFPEVDAIDEPGTLDGGDVCDAGDRAFIGVSARTNPAGARRAAAWLQTHGRAISTIDIRRFAHLLHLKSGIAYLGDGRIAVTEALHEALRDLIALTDMSRGSVAAGAIAVLGAMAETPLADLEIVRVPAGEEYAANCVRVNDRVLVAAGFPRFEAMLRELGYTTIALEMSEFEKMDGGLSCLSLRF
jgi:dimethylargininase